MSVDRDYNIRIRISAEGSGAPQAAEDLKNVGKASQEAGEGMKLFETHGREFHRLLSLLDQIVPGVGLALKAAFNPATLGIGVTVLLIEQVKNALTEYNQKLDEIGEAAAKADFAASIEAARSTTESAIEDQEKYLANLNEIEKGEHGVAVAMTQQLQLIAAIAAARQAQGEAEKTLALARIKEQEVSGALTPTAAALQRQKIDDKYVADKRAEEERRFQADQNARTAAAATASMKQGELERNQAAASDALAKAKAKRDRDLAFRPTDEAIKKAQQELEDANKDLDLDRRADGSLMNYEGFPEQQRLQQNRIFAAQVAKAALDRMEADKTAADQVGKVDLTQLEIAADQAKKDRDANAKAKADADKAFRDAQNQHDETAANKQSTDKSTIDTDAANTRTELMQRARTLQKHFLDNPSTMTRQEDAELLQLLRLIDHRVFEIGENAVTKEELQREIQRIGQKMSSLGH